MKLFVPINLNTATDEEILLIPGVGNRMLREFKEDTSLRVAGEVPSRDRQVCERDRARAPRTVRVGAAGQVTIPTSNSNFQFQTEHRGRPTLGRPFPGRISYIGGAEPPLSSAPPSLTLNPPRLPVRPPLPPPLYPYPPLFTHVLPPSLLSPPRRVDVSDDMLRHQERYRTDGAWLRAAVLGANDGICRRSSWSSMSPRRMRSARHPGRRCAGLVAGSLSMAAGST